MTAAAAGRTERDAPFPGQFSSQTTSVYAADTLLAWAESGKLGRVRSHKKYLQRLDIFETCYSPHERKVGTLNCLLLQYVNSITFSGLP